jgi:hypothetical protein
MKISVLLTLTGLIFGFTWMDVTADSVHTCSMGDYNYKGPVQSDSYPMPGTNGQKACQDREAMDSEKIGADYRKNIEKKISTLKRC